MKFKIIGIGEILWDLLPSGPQLGGAPANFACHARALGAQAAVITRVGGDDFGRDVIKQLGLMRVADQLVQVDDSAPTGTVTVTLTERGIPHFNIHEETAWDRLAPMPQALDAVYEADAVCFGTLAQRHEPSRSTVRQLLRAAPAKALRVLDINLRQSFYTREIIQSSLQLANVLKLNDAELPVLAEICELGGTPPEQIQQLAETFDIRLVALTRGAAGSLLFQSGQWSDCASVPISIVDTVGAGDAFTAALTMGLLQQWNLDQINRRADEVARYVCSCSGATPPLPKSVSDPFVVGPAKVDKEPEVLFPMPAYKIAP